MCFKAEENKRVATSQNKSNVVLIVPDVVTSAMTELTRVRIVSAVQIHKMLLIVSK